MTAVETEQVAQAVTGADVLDQLRATMARYVVFPDDESADAVTLYTAATHTAAHANCAPRLVVRSPEPRCGKSLLIADIMGKLVARQLTAVSISPAALVHSIDPKNPPTIILDETDTIFRGSGSTDDKTELLRGILNSGWKRGVPYVRWDAVAKKNDNCDTFAFAVLGGIDNGKMPDTIMDRSIVITMRRKAPHETVERYRERRDGPRLLAMADQLAAWIAPQSEALGDAWPDLPEELNDRAQDAWEPLLAIADLAGGDWPERARLAALVLNGKADPDEGTVTVRMLADAKTILNGRDRIHTDLLLLELKRMPDAPWAGWYGRGITARDVSQLLRPHGIKPSQMRIEGRSMKGYYAHDFVDAWARYLPDDEPADSQESLLPDGPTDDDEMPW